MDEDTCCTVVQNSDKEIVDNACIPYTHVASETYSFDPYSLDLLENVVGCTRTITLEKNWYLPSIYKQALLDYGDGEALDEAIVGGNVNILREGGEEET